MRLNKVKVMGKEYKIKYIPKLEDVNTTGTKDVLFGQISYVNGEIRIFSDFQKFDELQILLHEIIHAINTGLQVGIKETQVDQIATGMANVLIDNKMLKE